MKSDITKDNVFIEIGFSFRNHNESLICGDTFLYKKFKEENRYIIVLSDGMGHGVKANVLSALTATMALNFTYEHKEEYRIAEIILNTLPVCSERNISYATFTICDILPDSTIKILEHDNPETIIFRNNNELTITHDCLLVNEVNNENNKREIKHATFYPQLQDRLILITDGITQAGMGSDKYPFGWERERVVSFISKTLETEPIISAQKLAQRIVNMANKLDNYQPQDDMTCGVVYFRKPRKVLVVTGPPFNEKDDKKMAQYFNDFNGDKVICGATTADIISRELNKKIIDTFEFEDPELPPISYMDGANFITEGILTLSKVSDILFHQNPPFNISSGPAGKLLQLLIDSDEIYFLVGTKVNEAHQDPHLPVDLEIRRTVVRRIARQLEEKLLKEVNIEFI